MQLDSLKIYQEVVRTGSFSVVARQREVSPSSITRVVNQLEQQLGTRLLQRSTRRLALTEAGKLFFDRISPLLEELEQTQAELKDLSSSPKGKIRITASPSFGTTRLAPALLEFGRRFPELAIDLVLTDKVVDVLEENFDLAIRHGPLPDSSLFAQRLLTVRYRVCASPMYLAKHPTLTHPAELSTHTCLVFDMPAFRRQWKFRDQQNSEFDVTINSRMQVNSGMVLRQWALGGAGIVLLSDWLIGDDLTSGSLVDLFPNYDVTPSEFHPNIWLIYPSRSYVPEKISLIANFLKSYFQC